MAVDIFTNNASTSVAASKSAVSGGTQESWTVASSTGFPAASTSASPKTMFRFVDPAAPSEIMACTNVSGTTWTVIRGYEGTTPVAHSAGFTVVHVVSAAWLVGKNRTSQKVYNVKDFDAVGDGSTNDAGYFQAAIDAANAAGGGIVYVPEGSYRIDSQLSVSAGVTLKGAGNRKSILLGSPTAAIYDIVRLLASETRVCDLKIDGNGNSDITCLAFGGDNPPQTYNFMSVERVHITRATHVAAYAFAVDYINHFSFINNFIDDSNCGLIFGTVAGGGSTDIRVSGNTFQNIHPPAAYGRAVSFNGDGTYDTFKRVVISDNIFDACVAPNCITLEMTGCTDVTVSGNSLGPTGSRGISTGWCKNLALTGNSIEGQDVYAIELNSGRNVSITGNAINLCDSFVQSTNGTDPVVDCTISGNTITNSGYGTSVSNSIFMHNGCLRWSITNNLWRDCKSSGSSGVIRCGENDTDVNYNKSIVIADNTYIAAASDSDVNFITFRAAVDGAKISNNYVDIQRSVSSSFDYWAAIYLAGLSSVKNVTVDGNWVRMTGTNTANEYHGIDDGGAGSYSATGLTIRNNKATGFNRGVSFPSNTSADMIISGNETLGCLSADQFNSASRIFETTAASRTTLTSNFTTTSTTAVDSNLKFPIGKNETWTVTVWFMSSKATSSTGMKVGIGAPSGCTVTGYQELGGATFSTAMALSEITAINTLSAAFATGTGVKVPSRMHFQVTNGSTAGTISIQFATVTSNTATVYAGASLNATLARTV